MDYALCEGMAQRGEDFALITILTRDGSAPRGPGAKMSMDTRRRISGTIGGGRLEGYAMEVALEALETGAPRLLRVCLTTGEKGTVDMACGGDVNLLIEPISAKNAENQAHFRRVARCVRGEIPCHRITAVEETDGVVHVARAVRLGDGTIKGDLPDWAQSLPWQESLDQTEYRYLRLTETRHILVEGVCPAAQVYIFGGGHVGQKTAQLVAFQGQRVVVVDDRPEFLTADRFPGAETLCCPAYRDVFVGREITKNTFVVIVTRGHAYDSQVLEQALHTDAGYIGMIGSRGKVASTLEAMAAKGWPEETLRRVHAPIGLDIGAETPGEIAVSIAAQMIASARGGTRNAG